MKASDIMTSPVLTVSPDTQVREIAALLYERRISAVPVVDDGALIGIVSEADLLHRQEIGTECLGQGGSWWLRLFSAQPSVKDYVRSHATRARDVMTRCVVTVSPDAALAEVAQILETRDIGRVPVVKGAALVGIVSRANLVQALAVKAGAADASDHTDDQSIRRSLLEELERQGWWRLDRANVIVTDGVVHFWGMVESEDARPAARVAAENVPGVRRVQDHRFVSYNAPTMT
ncbi:MAG: CBS domain-containing protein [Betaproteobacteria bacterium]|nr:MAG: CBS domain-containing protein [Betaproteobacteria bacterium]